MDERDEDLNTSDKGELTPSTFHIASAHSPVRQRVKSVRTFTPVVAVPKGGALKAVVGPPHADVPQQRREA